MKNTETLIHELILKRAQKQTALRNSLRSLTIFDDDAEAIIAELERPRNILRLTHRKWNPETRTAELEVDVKICTLPEIWILRDPVSGSLHFDLIEILSSSGRRVWWRSGGEVDRKRRSIHQKLVARWDYMAEIEEKTGPGGVVMFQTGGRDCDMCEATDPPRKLEGGFRGWEKIIDNLHEWAEGPVWFWILEPKDVKNARHGSRDLALEAFEDGHAHVVRPGGPLLPASSQEVTA